MSKATENNERRAAPRVPVDFSARLWLDVGWSRVPCRDISETGLGLNAFKGRKAGSLVKLTLALPDKPDLEVTGEVVHQITEGAWPVSRVLHVDDEAELMAELGVLVTPTLVFFRDGELLGLLPRLRDWAVYMDEIPAILGISEQAA